MVPILKPKFSLLYILGCLYSAPLSTQAAVTIVQAFTFNNYSSGAFYSSNDPFDGFFTFERATSPVFTKFDPSLGTLERVLLSIVIDVEWSADVSVISVPNEDPYDLSANFGELEAGFYYEPSETIVLLSPISELSNVISTNVSGTGNDNGFESDFGSFGDASDSFVGTIEANEPDFVVSDFVGTGNVEGLSIGLFTVATVDWTLVNVDEASGNLDYTLFGGEATLQYEYTPIPEPATFGLLMGLAGWLLVIRLRRS